MKIFYGTDNYNIDITNICIDKLVFNNKLCIPSGKLYRSFLFTNKIFRTQRYVIIHINNERYVCDDTQLIVIDIKTQKIDILYENDTDKYNNNEYLSQNYDNKVKLYKNFMNGNEKVLVIGSNKCEFALSLCKIVSDNNCIILEPNEEYRNYLEDNKIFSNNNYYVEDKILYYKNCMINTINKIIPSDILLDDYKWIQHIEYNELEQRYNINFDTIFLEYSNMLYFYCKYMKDIFKNIRLLIINNNFKYDNDKEFISNILEKEDFYCIYENNIYVWKKD